MQLRYGQARFLFNGCQVTTQQQTLMSANKIPHTLDIKAFVHGYLESTSSNPQNDLSIQERAMRLALATPYQDLVLAQDDGSDSATVLRNLGSLSGVQIIDGPNFGGTTGGEYANQREFTFTAWCQYPVVLTGQNFLMEFNETLSFSGGGPLYIMRRSLNTKPQRQLIYKFTEYVCIQSGSATWYGPNPKPAPALFPGFLKSSPNFSFDSPTRVGKGYFGYTVKYQYDFESPSPLVAAPNIWLP